MTSTLTKHLTALAIVVCCGVLLCNVRANESKTIIGPSIAKLQDGANALLAGNAEEGVRLAMIGLKHVASRCDRQTALSNLCAGYIMLEQLDTALKYRNRVLEENE